MASSNGLQIGFSSGALDPGQPSAAVAESLVRGLRTIELSALRTHELEGVRSVLLDPRMAEFDYVSVHAPSRFAREEEGGIVNQLVEISGGRFPIVVHPDVIYTPALWRRLGRLLLIENMDRRKSVGRFAREFHALFRELPEAGLCLDVAHARQVDPTMTEAASFLNLFGDRLREIHISEVGSASSHGRISAFTSTLFGDLLQRAPSEVPVIIESVLGGCEPMDEVSEVASILAAARELST